MTTSYKDGVNAVDRLIREAEQVRRKIDPERLGATGFPGFPMLRPHEIPDYLRKLRFWVDEQKEVLQKSRVQ